MKIKVVCEAAERHSSPAWLVVRALGRSRLLAAHVSNEEDDAEHDA